MKKTLFLLTAFVLMFGLFACNGATTNPVTTNGPTPTTSIITQTPTTVTSEPTTVPITENRIIQGTVHVDEVAVSGATVRIRNTSYEVQTDSEGNFSFEITDSPDQLPEFRLIVTKEGYVQATRDVLATDFIANTASVSIGLSSATVTLFGIVSDADGVLAGVTVRISGTNTSTVTDASGAYSFTIDRPLGITLVFEKDFYEIRSLVLSDFTSGNQFENDVVLDDLALSVSGSVYHFASGAIGGAVVQIEGTEYETVSASDGSFSFSDLHLSSDEFVLLVSHSGYLNAAYPSDDFDDYDAVELELIADYIPLGALDAPYLVEGFLTKSSDGFYFKFVADDFRYSAGQEEKVQVYFNPGQYTENNRLNGSHTVEIALTSNNDIVVVVSYLDGVRFLTSILWGTELIYETHEVDDKVEISLFVKYSVFGDYAGADFAIDQDDVVGIGMNFWTDHDSVNLYHWYRDDMLGVDGQAIVAHNNPQDWVRIASDGRSIFEGSSNTVLAPQERTLSGEVTIDDIAVEDAIVTIEGLDISTTTDSNGAYSLVIPADKINVSVLTVSVAYPNYTFRGSVARNAFVDNHATLNVAMELIISSLNASGTVVDAEGLPLPGVTVAIRNTSFSVTTDSEGHFAFVDVAHTTLPYTLDFSKEGYKAKSLAQNNLTLVLAQPILMEEALPVQVGHEDIVLSEEAVYLGTVGPDEFAVYVSFVDGTLTMTYVTSSGSFTNAPFEEKLSQYFIFGESEVYEVRAINGTWTGVFRPQAGAWATWTPEIHNPVITDNEGVYTLSQDIELSYFANLGLSLNEIYFCVFEVTTEGSDALIYNDEFQLTITDSSNWLRFIIPTDDDDEPIDSPVLNLTDEFQLLGTFGEDSIVGSIRFEAGAIITQYVVASGSFTNSSYEEAIRQYFVFGESQIYEVRIIPVAWTGVYLPQAGYFGAWTSEIGVPEIVDDGTNVTFTQVIQLSYFENLELDLDNIRFGLFQNTESGNHVLTYDDVELVIANQDTWITIVIPQSDIE